MLRIGAVEWSLPEPTSSLYKQRSPDIRPCRIHAYDYLSPELVLFRELVYLWYKRRMQGLPPAVNYVL